MKKFNGPSFWLRYLIDRDRRSVPLALRPLYKKIFFHSLRVLGTPPNIFRGKDFNNKIRWSMLFDQSADTVVCSDKLAVRDWVAARIGQAYLNKIYSIWDDPSAIDFGDLPPDFVLKTNHDSGSVWIIRDKSSVDLPALRAKVAGRMNRVYGAEKGEWAYSHIHPKAFAEEMLSAPEEGISDYKFHCAGGRVAFVQYISERRTAQPSEQIVMPDGKVSEYLLDSNFRKGSGFERPIEWNEMITIAEKLAQPFAYVRVDLYLVYGQIRFGEMTFAPRAGCYRGADQAALGALLALDRAHPRPPFHAAW